jgi:hypothetical protein
VLLAGLGSGVLVVMTAVLVSNSGAFTATVAVKTIAPLAPPLSVPSVQVTVCPLTLGPLTLAGCVTTPPKLRPAGSASVINTPEDTFDPTLL